MRLAQLGADVVLVGRDKRRLDETRAEASRIARHDRVFQVRADFASLASIRAAAEEIAQRWPALDVLVNNAGVNSAERAMSTDGYEMTFAVNHLGPFFLTTLLVPALARGGASRIVNVTSVFAHLGRIHFDDLMSDRRRYDAVRAYNQSKLANTMFTMELGERLRDSGITVNCVSPGLVATELMREHRLFTTPLMRPLWRAVLLAPEQAAERIVRVATASSLASVTGQCFAGSDRPITVPRAARDANARRRLWDVSATLTGAPDLAVPGSWR